MIDLTIDTCVIVNAGGPQGPQDLAFPCYSFLRSFDHFASIFATVDDVGFVLKEYADNLNASKFGAYWLRQHAERIKKVKMGPLPRGLRVQLDEAHFSTKDRRFVQVALRTRTKAIISTDPDFSADVQTILRREVGIRVYGPLEALEYIHRLQNEQA